MSVAALDGDIVLETAAAEGDRLKAVDVATMVESEKRKATAAIAMVASFRSVVLVSVVSETHAATGTAAVGSTAAEVER